MKKNQVLEKVIHGIFLLLGLITVGCVLLITVYLVISGIPAIRQIDLVDFLFGDTWASTAAEPKYGILPFILTSVYGTAGAIGYASVASVKDTVKALTVAGVAPSNETILDGSYVIQRPFVLVTKADASLSAAAQAFFDYAVSADAHEIITAAGVVPAN